MGEINKLEKKTENSPENEENIIEILKAVNVVDPPLLAKIAFEKLKRKNPDILEKMPDFFSILQDDIFRQQQCTYLLAEDMKEQIGKIRDSLGYQTSSEMERLLIRQICINFLRINFLENVHAVKTTENHDVEIGVYWEKRLDTAHRRYMRSIETLAKVRKYLAEASFRESQAETNRAKAAKLIGGLVQQ